LQNQKKPTTAAAAPILENRSGLKPNSKKEPENPKLPSNDWRRIRAERQCGRLNHRHTTNAYFIVHTHYDFKSMYLKCIINFVVITIRFQINAHKVFVKFVFCFRFLALSHSLYIPSVSFLTIWRKHHRYCLPYPRWYHENRFCIFSIFNIVRCCFVVGLVLFLWTVWLPSTMTITIVVCQKNYGEKKIVFFFFLSINSADFFFFNFIVSFAI